MAGLVIPSGEGTKKAYEGDTPGESAKVPYWEADDAPAGSTSSSHYVVDENGRKKVAGPTHYVHLSNGTVIAGYSGGTHYVMAGEDGKDQYLKVVGAYPA